MIARLQSWALTALAILAVLVGAYAAGGRAARRSMELKQSRDDALRADAVVKGIRDARDEMSKMDIRDIRNDLRTKWVRSVNE